jgi:hypothetical protein
MGEALHSFTGPPRTHERARKEVAQQTTTTPQSHHEGCSYYPSHGYTEPSLWAGTSAFARYPDWYAPFERYVSYGVDQVERMVKGIGWLEWQMDDFAHVQIEMQAFIDSQTSMMHDLFGHFGINPDA